MTYEIRATASNTFAVWGINPYGDRKVVKTFKTRKGAENWVRKHS